MNKPDANDLWQLTFQLPLDQAHAIEPIFEDFALTSSMIEAVSDGSLWNLELLFAGKPENWLLDQIPDGLDFDLYQLEQRDWVSESQKQQPPVATNRFYIHGSHDPAYPLPSKYDLVIEAGRAFGTGLHETTYGCLSAIDDFAKIATPHKILDLGCGSGVLSLAATKMWKKQIIASDIDLDAVIVTNENAKANKLAPFVRTVHATGLNDRFLKAEAPYDLIIANILAWPLVKLAPQISQAIADNGTLILSGLLQKQDNMVRSAYRLHGLSVRKRYTFGDWNTLVLSR